MDEPGVWKDQNVTIILNGQTACIYVGTNKVGFIKELNLKLNDIQMTPNLELKFPAPDSIAIEENMRLVKTIPWIKVI